MKTLCGDGKGIVLDLAVTIPKPSRCQFEDDYGRCKEDTVDGDMFCASHRELILLRAWASSKDK